MRLFTALATALALTVFLLAAGTAAAQPRHGPGGGPGGGPGAGGHGGGHGQGSQGQAGQGQGSQGQAAQHPGRGGQSSQIAEGDRGLIQAYFGQQIAQGNCPPGLAKKNNGCQPSGQARRWAVGQPLPAGLGYALPPDLLRRLAPPAGYTYMRVGTDVLMIAAGSGMVAAGVQDLLR